MILNSEELFTKFLIYKKFYTPFNWNIKTYGDRYKLKNIKNNKCFIKQKKFFNMICNKYPYDLENLIHGFYLEENNFYNINYNKISYYILLWNKFLITSKGIISTNINNIKQSLIKKDNNNVEDLIKFIYNSDINNITIGYLFFNYKKIYNYIIEESRGDNKSLEKEIFLKNVFTYIQREKVRKLTIKLN